MWCHTAISPKFPGTGGSPVDINSLPSGNWATAALVQLPMPTLMMMEIRWYPVGMVPVLLEAPSSFSLQYCMPGRTEGRVTGNKITNGDLSGIFPQMLEQVALENWGFGHLCSLLSRSVGEHSPCSGRWQAGICSHGYPVIPWGHQGQVRSVATSEFTSGYQWQEQHWGPMKSLDQSGPPLHALKPHLQRTSVLLFCGHWEAEESVSWTHPLVWEVSWVSEQWSLRALEKITPFMLCQRPEGTWGGGLCPWVEEGASLIWFGVSDRLSCYSTLALKLLFLGFSTWAHT